MVENYFERPHAVRHCRSACTGPHIDDLAAVLSAEGYSRSAGRSLLRGVAKLGHWLDAQNVVIAHLDEALVKRFVDDQMSRPGGGRSNSLRRQFWACGRRLLTWGRERDVVSTTAPQRPVAGLICDFEAWMQSHRGSSEKTLQGCYRLPLQRFLDAVGQEPLSFDASGIRRFILTESQRAGRGYGKTLATAIRMLLRYLAIHGLCRPELVDAVPKFACWKLAALPAFLSREAVDRIVAACDPATVSGRRDRAMLVLMARLAFRAGEVAELRFADLNWTEATITVSGKSRRSVRMPLVQEVGDALLLWLSDGRSDLEDDHVFLRLYAPHGPLDRTGVSSVVLRAAKRADVSLPRAGAHVLRHSVATELLNDGMSLPGIGAILRHRNLDTTTIYAKVDRTLLESVARPWPLEVS